MISRISSARCAVCIGGSSVGSWSLIGSSSRCLLDERADVVADERHRETRERSGHRVARRERRGVVEHRDRFFVAGHHHHVVMRLALHRALRAEVLEVRDTDRRRTRGRGRSRSRRSRSHRRPFGIVSASFPSRASQLDERRHAARRRAVAGRGRRRSSSAEPNRPSSTIVRLRKRWNGWSVVKPMPGEHLLAVRGDGARGAAGGRLRERGGHRVRFVGRPRRASRRALRSRRARRRAGGARPGTRAIGRPNCTRSTRVRAREVEHRPARARDLVRDRAPAERDRRVPRVGVEPRRRRRRRRVDAHDVEAGVGVDAARPARRSTTRGTVTAHASDPAPHTTSSSRRRSRARSRARRAHASPSMRPGGSHVPNGGSSTARSARGVMPSAATTTSSSAVAARVRRARARSNTIVDRVVAARRRASRASRARRARRRRAGRVGAPASASRTVASSSAAFGRVHQSSAPRSSRRRAMMLRCTSAVPP